MKTEKIDCNVFLFKSEQRNICADASIRFYSVVSILKKIWINSKPILFTFKSSRLQ